VSARSPWTQLVALRRLQQEQVEAELLARRRLRQRLLSAAEQCRLETREEARALIAALESGQHDYEVAGAIQMKLSPLRERWLERQLCEVEAAVNEVAEQWRDARVQRMQVESMLTDEQQRARKEAETREQKSLDSWFLMRQPTPVRVDDAPDESSQRFTGSTGSPMA
jgi:flagellar biosynthesis chaperone FliJ